MSILYKVINTKIMSMGQNEEPTDMIFYGNSGKKGCLANTM